ncbi:MAG: hypothetical protein OFPI_18770 [Osedax symbiont Rs2]|nr:MAG: hypothetical protein OFPI_18770 [Osedax symbiont Rs2]
MIAVQLGCVHNITLLAGCRQRLPWRKLPAAPKLNSTELQRGIDNG